MSPLAARLRLDFLVGLFAAGVFLSGVFVSVAPLSFVTAVGTLSAGVASFGTRATDEDVERTDTSPLSARFRLDLRDP
jgi:hypothetical protein